MVRGVQYAQRRSNTVSLQYMPIPQDLLGDGPPKGTRSISYAWDNVL